MGSGDILIAAVGWRVRSLADRPRGHWFADCAALPCEHQVVNAKIGAWSAPDNDGVETEAYEAFTRRGLRTGLMCRLCTRRMDEDPG